MPQLRRSHQSEFHPAEFLTRFDSLQCWWGHTNAFFHQQWKWNHRGSDIKTRVAASSLLCCHTNVNASFTSVNPLRYPSHLWMPPHTWSLTRGQWNFSVRKKGLFHWYELDMPVSSQKHAIFRLKWNARWRIRGTYAFSSVYNREVVLFITAAPCCEGKNLCELWIIQVSSCNERRQFVFARHVSFVSTSAGQFRQQHVFCQTRRACSELDQWDSFAFCDSTENNVCRGSSTHLWERLCKKFYCNLQPKLQSDFYRFSPWWTWILPACVQDATPSGVQPRVWTFLCQLSSSPFAYFWATAIFLSQWFKRLKLISLQRPTLCSSCSEGRQNCLGVGVSKCLLPDFK